MAALYHGAYGNTDIDYSAFSSIATGLETLPWAYAIKSYGSKFIVSNLPQGAYLRPEIYGD